MRINLLFGIVAMSLLVGLTAAQERPAPAATPSSSGNWRLVGPTDSAPMEEVEGGDVGRINTFVFHPSRLHTIFAATPVGGL
ncbi:MAG: hypothetical protein ACLQNV_12950, partial [Steroidobacteraceae bacterium]